MASLAGFASLLSREEGGASCAALRYYGHAAGSICARGSKARTADEALNRPEGRLYEHIT